MSQPRKGRGRDEDKNRGTEKGRGADPRRGRGLPPAKVTGSLRWILDYGERMRRLGDERRHDLLYYTWRALECRDEDPEQAMALYEKGQQEARELREPWWVVLFDYFKLQTITASTSDYLQAREIVVRAVEEIKKPVFARFPQRICLHEDLIRVHVSIDPAGYAPTIEAGIAYMERELTPDSPCHECLHSVKTRFAVEMGRWDVAHELLLRSIATDRKPDRNLAANYTEICLAAYHRGDWEGLSRWAMAGEAIARDIDYQECVAEFMLWQAMLARRDGDEPMAQRLCNAALVAARRGTRLLAREYYDTLCTFYTMSGEYALAAQAREREIAGLRAKGQFANEAHAYIEYCRLRARLGRPLDKVLPAATARAALLVDPAPALAELDRIARGETGLS